MSKIDFLKEQIIESRDFVNRLVSELPESLWYTIPQGTDSNFAWQIGAFGCGSTGKKRISCHPTGVRNLSFQ